MRIPHTNPTHRSRSRRKHAWLFGGEYKISAGVRFTEGNANDSVMDVTRFKEAAVASEKPNNLLQNLTLSKSVSFLLDGTKSGTLRSIPQNSNSYKGR